MFSRTDARSDISQWPGHVFGMLMEQFGLQIASCKAKQSKCPNLNLNSHSGNALCLATSIVIHHA